VLARQNPNTGLPLVLVSVRQELYHLSDAPSPLTTFLLLGYFSDRVLLFASEPASDYDPPTYGLP
jgi:hypothetical protein